MSELFDLFKTFCRIGGLTFGGGYAMLPMLEKEVVENKKWATSEELLDYYAVGQTTPGIIAVNTATFIGYKVRGFMGALFATMGVVFPSIVIIMIIATSLQNFSKYEIVQNAFSGIRVVVAVLILNAIIKLWKSSVIDKVGLFIFILIFICGAFFKTGLFAIGGGLATLPFLYDISRDYSWFDESTLADMLAVSQSTPGPIGINMATYAGFNAAGVIGSIIATIALVMPSFIIIIIIARFLNKFRESKQIEAIFYGIRPAVTGLIAVAWFEIINISILTLSKFIETKNILNLFDYKALILFIVVFFISRNSNKHPIIFLLIGAFAGILFKL